MIVKNGNTLHLMGKNISYVMYINEFGDLLHYHFGGKIADRDYSGYRPFYADVRAYAPAGEDGLENFMQEYPAYGYNDLRPGAYTVLNKDCNTVSRLKYKSHRVYDGKYAVDGMPSVFGDGAGVQTLEITLSDDIAGFDTVLYYSVFDDYDVITRSVRFIAKSEVELKRVFSASLDLDTGAYEAICFTGDWARECELQRCELREGTTLEISNARGGSGHHANPFIMVCEPGAGETHGKVYGFSLIYSGDHTSLVSMDVRHKLRVQSGINPNDFAWSLSEGEEFQTPECVMCYSPDGFHRISHNYHDIYRNHLCRSKWAHMDRPVLINNFEGTFFNFDEEKLLAIAKTAAAAGCELFVLDDGWFGKRNDHTTSLGDWYANKEKLPDGIAGLAEKINALGLKFGLWFEPEMVSPDSDLYRAHPDWAVRVNGRQPSLGTNQLILDLARREVRDYIVDAVSAVLSSANISYVKWDMNRYMTDRPCPGYCHRYTLGLYEIMDRICGAFPDVLFEGCASGGGRFDPGILAYMPQIWTSDNSDAVSRLRIQYSTSFAYPFSSMSAHVTAVPNHQTRGRTSSLSFRADTATTGSFGYELDITKLSADELDTVRQQTERYKKLRTLLRTGDFYRLQNPYESELCAWAVTAKDKSEIFVFSAKRLMSPCRFEPRLPLRGIDPEAIYKNSETGETYSGSELMNVGLELELGQRDYVSKTILLTRQ